MSGFDGSMSTSLPPVFDVLEEDALEALAAVGRAEDAALLVRAVRMAERGDEQAIRVARIDGELGNLLRVAEAEMRPRRAGVGGFVDAVADRRDRGGAGPRRSRRRGCSDRRARPRPSQSIRSAGRRRSASTCARRQWSSRRRRCTCRCRTCTDGSDVRRPLSYGRRGRGRCCASASRKRALG